MVFFAHLRTEQRYKCISHYDKLDFRNYNNTNRILFYIF